MKRIPQHSESSTLIDIANFIPFLEAHLQLTSWDISVSFCTGDNRDQVEKTATSPLHLTHDDFKSLYEGIRQTIDGEFHIQTTKGKIKLFAVDSSFWEVESDISELEELIENEFGKYI